jgi:pyruvate,water dikinase
LSDRALVDEMEILGGPDCEALVRSNGVLVIAFVVQALGDAVFRAHPRARRLLTAGVRGNPTTRISLAVDELVEAAEPLAALFAEALPAAALLARLTDSSAGREWRVRFRAFLELAGQRGPKEFDFASPRWADDPTMILDLVRAGLRGGGGRPAHDRLERMAGERRQAIAEARSRSSWWRRPLLGLAAGAVERFAPLREAPKHAVMVAFHRMRLAALEAGTRLFRRGYLDDAADVMFLERGCVASALLDPGAPRDLRSPVAAGRARHERHLAARPPDFLRSDGVRVVEPGDDGAPGADGALRGLGASSGAASGPVRILLVPDPSAMRDGDVLVVPFADPGWTPLFPRAGALVMEVGGLMCHAAVVARELGVPAVFGVAGATVRLKEGQVVRVDGDAGTVTPA